MGYHVGQRMVDVLFVREKNFKRETKLINILLFVKTNLWKVRIKMLVSMDFKSSVCFSDYRNF